MKKRMILVALCNILFATTLFAQNGFQVYSLWYTDHEEFPRHSKEFVGILKYPEPETNYFKIGDSEIQQLLEVDVDGTCYTRTYFYQYTTQDGTKVFKTRPVLEGDHIYEIRIKNSDKKVLYHRCLRPKLYPLSVFIPASEWEDYPHNEVMYDLKYGYK